MKIHNVFHVNLLEQYNNQDKSEVSPLPSIVVDDKKVFEVKKILDSKLYYGKF